MCNGREWTFPSQYGRKDAARYNRKKTQNVQDRLLQPHVDSETLHVVSWAPWCLSSPSLPALLPMITFFFFPCLFLSHFVSAAFLIDIQGPGISNILKFPLQLRLCLQIQIMASQGLLSGILIWHISPGVNTSLKIELCRLCQSCVFHACKASTKWMALPSSTAV